MATILITGGSGLIGQHIIPQLLQKGHTIRVLTRRKDKGMNSSIFQWNVDEGFIEDGALDGVDHIIHLAGYNVSEGRWTDERKRLMEDSRIKSVHLLKSKLGQQKIKSFISASGVSIYGVKTVDTIFTEAHEIDNEEDDYLAQLSEKWEAASNEFRGHAERVVVLRTPIVLTKNNGALGKLAGPIKKGFGSPLGSGKQWMPWVHIDDLVKAYVMAVEKDNFEGTFNVSAPEHATNKEFTLAVAKTLGKKIWLPKVPSFVLKLLFGEMANIILKGSRVSGDALTRTSFEYEYPNLDVALFDLLVPNEPE